MNVVIRADASLHIGTGHVMRCLVFSRELKKLGYDVHFIMRRLPGNLIGFIKEQGLKTIELPLEREYVRPSSDSDYAGWLQVTEEQDAIDFNAKVKSADLVLVDHYALGVEWERTIRKQLDCNVLVFDDLMRNHHADFLVDPTFLRNEFAYNDKNSAGINLIGTDFAIIDPSFSVIRERKIAVVHSSEDKILLSMGGIDKDGVTLDVMKSLFFSGLNFPPVTVLISPKSPSYDEVKEMCVNNKDKFTQLDFTFDMASLMEQHSIAIGAPGGTSWERCALGIPSILIPLADNQLAIASSLENNNAAIVVQRDNLNSSILKAYLKLVEHKVEMRDSCFRICDGYGLRRVLQFVLSTSRDRNQDIFIRTAKENDIKQVYDWQCMPETRKYALNTKAPSWEEHLAWMTSKIADVRNYFYIISSEKPENSKGVVRLDRFDVNKYIISIFISPESYGKGIAQNALKAIDTIHPNIEIHATVLENNIPSQKLFTSAGYKRSTKESFVRLPINGM